MKPDDKAINKALDRAEGRLSEPNQKLLDWLKIYLAENRTSPSLRQIMKAMQLRSPSAAASRLAVLKKRGYITVEGTKNKMPQTISIVELL
jgi:SOS-response transcriptional repressor LexA